MRAAPVGETFGFLTVVGLGSRYVRPNGRSAGTRWRLVCVFGGYVEVFPSNLRAGRTISCGCMHERTGRTPQHYFCSISGCHRRHYARTFCESHYKRDRQAQTRATS